MRALTLVSILGALVSLSACEREVVGETFEGQKAGGRSLQVSDNSPPPGATHTSAAPKEAQLRDPKLVPVPPTDPAIAGLLFGSGARSLGPRNYRINQQNQMFPAPAHPMVMPAGMPQH